MPSTFFAITGARQTQKAFEHVNYVVDIPSYVYILIYFRSKIANGGKPSFAEKKLLWWLRKVESNTAPFSKLLGPAALLFSAVADMQEYRESKIGLVRLLFRLGGAGVSGAIMGAEGGAPGVVAGAVVGVLWAGEKSFMTILFSLMSWNQLRDGTMEHYWKRKNFKTIWKVRCIDYVI